MRLMKPFIAVFLLLTYSVGFAHNLIPHHHHITTGIGEAGHHHEHHQHGMESSFGENHEHIEHQDHFDENLLDLLICMLHDFEHSEGECYTQYLVVPKKSTQPIGNSKVKLICTLLSFVLVNPFESVSQNFCEGDETAISVDVPDNARDRAPPVFSC